LAIIVSGLSIYRRRRYNPCLRRLRASRFVSIDRTAHSPFTLGTAAVLEKKPFRGTSFGPCRAADLKTKSGGGHKQTWEIPDAPPWFVNKLIVHTAPKRRAAMDALMLVATLGGSTMFHADQIHAGGGASGSWSEISEQIATRHDRALNRGRVYVIGVRDSALSDGAKMYGYIYHPETDDWIGLVKDGKVAAPGGVSYSLIDNVILAPDGTELGYLAPFRGLTKGTGELANLLAPSATAHSQETHERRSAPTD
jgi:hypothetical protein